MAGTVDQATRNYACGGWRLRDKRGADGFGAAAFYRFFQFVRLDGTRSARVVVEQLGLSGKPWVLVIDRTI
jgi:hypothetical protein